METPEFASFSAACKAMSFGLTTCGEAIGIELPGASGIFLDVGRGRELGSVIWRLDWDRRVDGKAWTRLWEWYGSAVGLRSQ
jgi:hypothetical protein